ncbi:MAG: threonine synthase, partial [Chlamydiales bacterium]
GCGGTLDVVHDIEGLRGKISTEAFDERLRSTRAEDRSGVWRFRELIVPIAPEQIVTRGEGRTNLYDVPALAARAGVGALLLKHEGENPTGSFKDRGMTAGITVARALGKRRVACASTGNTSASMASYAAASGMEAIVFIPEGQVAYGKLSQALAYGARTLQIDGDFDAAMEMVQELCSEESIYLLNSVNPFRIEGQKSIGFELLQDMGWEIPDWIVLPGGNLGNSSAIAKGLLELRDLGLISRLPRMAVVQATGANPLFRAWSSGEPLVPIAHADTLASAIRIGAPISWRKCLRGLQALDGVVCEVTDQEILDAKAHVDRSGVGAEPASCATYAGICKLAQAGVLGRGETISGILTGNLLKDPDIVVQYHRGELDGFSAPLANAPTSVACDLDAIRRILGVVNAT